MLRISLIGMSGAGKTFWAKKLAEIGYRTVSCDDRIEAHLAPELAAGGFRPHGDVAAWMGWPNSSTYPQRVNKYLDAEVRVMRETIAELESDSRSDCVVDTTGSVVYTGENICRRLQQLTTVVYLEASASEQQTLISRYLQQPKPVIWGELYRPEAQGNESPEETIARCYPQLIAQRTILYEHFAHCIVPLASLHDAVMDANTFLALVQNARRQRR